MPPPCIDGGVGPFVSILEPRLARVLGVGRRFEASRDRVMEHLDRDLAPVVFASRDMHARKGADAKHLPSHSMTTDVVNIQRAATQGTITRKQREQKRTRPLAGARCARASSFAGFDDTHEFNSTRIKVELGDVDDSSTMDLRHCKRACTYAGERLQNSDERRQTMRPCGTWRV